MSEGKRDIIRILLQEYEINNANDIQEALKDLLGGTIKKMMESEMDEQLDCEKANVLIVMTGSPTFCTHFSLFA